jgi:hypothetical protein
MPCASKVPLKPNKLKTILITTIIAMLVAIKRKIRIMVIASGKLMFVLYGD